MSDQTAIDAATRRLSQALDALDAAVERRLEADRSEARLAGFFAHQPDALFVVRAERGAGRDTGRAGFTFETVNPAFCSMFAIAPEQIEGAGPDWLLALEGAAQLDHEFAECLRTGQPRSWESATTGSDGTRHLHTVLVPLPADADGVMRLLGSLRDVTELRRLQLDLVEQDGEWRTRNLEFVG